MSYQHETPTYWVLITDETARLVFESKEKAYEYMEKNNLYQNTKIQKVYGTSKRFEPLEFGVDSGTFWIGDLGYIVGHPEKYGNDEAWNKICEQLRQPLPAPIESGLMFSTGRDGGFNVKAYKDKNDKVTKVVITVNSEDDS